MTDFILKFLSSFLKIQIGGIFKRFFSNEFRYWTSFTSNRRFRIIFAWLIISTITMGSLLTCFYEYTEKTRLQAQAMSIAKQAECILNRASDSIIYLSDLYKSIGITSKQPYLDFLRRSHRTIFDTKTYEKALYSKFVVIENSKETIRIENLSWENELRNIETLPDSLRGDREKLYYLKTIEQAKEGVPFASFLERLYSPEKTKLEAAHPGNFQGWIVFGYPLFEEGSNKSYGAILLYLDFVHIIELVRHVDSVKGKVDTWDYREGNYAAIIDVEGWCIAHPRVSHLRGTDDKGKEVDFFRSAEQAGKLPMRIQMLEGRGKASETVNELYESLYMAILKGKSGSKKYSNLKGNRRLLVYSPINFNLGAYAKEGVFGGVWMGKNISLLERIFSYPTSYFENLEAIPYILSLIFIYLALTYSLFRKASNTGISKFIDSLSPKNRKIVLNNRKGALESDIRHVVVLHADIRNFMKMSSVICTWDLKKLSLFIKTFRDQMSDIINSHNGVICNLFNDQLVAVFNAFDKEDDALNKASYSSVKCAMDMHDVFNEFYSSFRSEQNQIIKHDKRALADSEFPELGLGIGIAAGQALTGEISGNSKDDFNFTVMGSTVSFVFMEELKSEMGQTLIDNNTANLLTEDSRLKLKIELEEKEIELCSGEKVMVHIVKKSNG